MTGRLLPTMLLALAGLTGCTTWQGVPLRDGAYARNAVLIGDQVRVETRSGEEHLFTVTNVENGALTGSDGESVQPADMASLEVRRVNRRTTIIVASVIGGVLGTAWLLDELDDCGEGILCEYEY